MAILTTEELTAFEEDIAAQFNLGKIKSPIHLQSGNEQALVDVFDNNCISTEDWVLCSWRGHIQCLLKGVPQDTLKQQILDGKSMSLCFPEYKIFSSAIVTGILPISVGIALNIKRTNSTGKVYCFVGDMTALTGSFDECLRYSTQYDLPIKFVIEDNQKSVCTNTAEVWKFDTHPYANIESTFIEYYSYKTKWPHAGAGARVQF